MATSLARSRPLGVSTALPMLGRPPFGRPSLGRPSFGRPPFGRPPFGRPPSGPLSSGLTSAGMAPTGRNSTSPASNSSSGTAMAGTPCLVRKLRTSCSQARCSGPSVSPAASTSPAVSISRQYRSGVRTFHHLRAEPIRGYQVRVGGAADAPVLTLRPVQEVVSAACAGRSPVRDLVPFEAGIRQHCLSEQVLVRLVVVGGMARWLRGQRRPRLDRQGVGADVSRSRLEAEHRVQRSPASPPRSPRRRRRSGQGCKRRRNPVSPANSTARLTEPGSCCRPSDPSTCGTID